jgi:hypothetical protein
MKKMMMIAAGLILLLATAAFAQSEEDFEVGLTEDMTGVVIIKYTGKAVAVRIPATIQGMPVREIGSDAFSGNNVITSVVIPAGVTTINGNSDSSSFGYSGGTFYRCGKLAQVTLPAGLISIGKGVFSGCTALQAVTLPEGLISIGEGAFSDCTALQAVTLPDSVTFLGAWAFQNSGVTSVILSKGLTHIVNGIFSECKRLANVVIPEGITIIGGGENYKESGSYGTFEGCTALVSVTLPSTLVEIQDSAFRGSGLRSVVIPEGVTTIDISDSRESRRGAFRECKALASVTLPSTIKYITIETFSDCSSLTTVTIPDSVATIQIGSDAFRGCSKLPLASQAALKRRGYTGSF